MKEQDYRDFSLRSHQINWDKGKPNMCHFELTFACPLNCKHCYSSCYNKPQYLKRELSTGQVKQLLDKLYKEGVLWLNLCGGEPLSRKDFKEIYIYSKEKGFIITLFTSGFFIDNDFIKLFKKYPPFCIEMTINSVNKVGFDSFSQTPDSFENVFKAINLLKQNKISLKLKTMVVEDNLSEITLIKQFIEGLGLDFKPFPIIHPRLNQDVSACKVRISPEKVASLKGLLGVECLDCETADSRRDKKDEPNDLFSCVVGSQDTVHIDPYGKMFLCLCLRQFYLDLFKHSVKDGFKMFAKITSGSFKTDSKCKTCSLKQACFSCPGKAYLETGGMESPVDWFCRLTHLLTDKQKAWA